VRKINQEAETAEPNEAASSANYIMADSKEATARSASSHYDALQQLGDVDTGITQSMSAKTSPIVSVGGLAVKEGQSQPADIASNAASRHSTNPFLGQPLLPSLTMGVPKAALQGWYGQRPERFQVSKDQYVSWNDGGRPHELKFTCLFVCPLSGEVFSSGRYGTNSDLFVVRADEATGADVIWYSKYFRVRCHQCLCSSLAHLQTIFSILQKRNRIQSMALLHEPMIAIRIGTTLVPLHGPFDLVGKFHILKPVKPIAILPIPVDR
jgi:hypothetical protein